MKKLTSLLIYLFLGIGLPLGLNPALVFQPKILVVMASCAIILLTQPAMDPAEAKAQSATDRYSFWVILWLSLIGIAAPVVEWGQMPAIAQVSISGASLLGLIILLSGILLRVWAIRVLGRYFTATVQIVEDHQIVQTGPYRWLRHPSYTGSWMAFIGVGLWLEAYLGLLLAFVGMSIAYYLRIRAEEQTLVRQFGHLYQTYQRNTYRLIPLIW